MTQAVNARPSLEATIQSQILDMYEAVATEPDQDFHFFHGREAAEQFGYDHGWLDRAPAGAVNSFAGVGNPHERANLQPGERVLDLGSGAGFDSIIASWPVGETGAVIGVDLNPTMLDKARGYAMDAGSSATIEFREGSMEAIPVDDGDVDAIISNGVINLSFTKSNVIEEMYRVLAPGGRFSITDIVSARPLSQDIKDDPKLWAS
jgi:arsenite methyltransferase